ncbi:MAG: exodeoxyribonuclease V subunit beta [Betaproteobacteria bacterium]|nr:exodeoxyribonuclease V subunit beta [Betaproteobacteria bacterium]
MVGALSSEPLDPLRLPLWGSRLIEASAGTGKTWTIAALYLRLVLGHGAPGDAWREPLAPMQILVMTFTRAATQELRERIRRRLALAAACFRGDCEVPPDDELLGRVLQGFDDPAARELAAWRLAQAAESMDDAAVFTIDAWCQRMLREHAFDSGSLFDEQLLTDDTELLQAALRDIWRREVYPLHGDVLRGVLESWPQLDDFARQVGARVRRRAATGLARELGAAGELGAAWQRVDAQRREALDGLRGRWRPRLPELRAWLLELCEQDNPFKANMVSAPRVRPWFDALQQWVDAGDGGVPELDAAAWLRLSPQGLRDALKKGRDVAVPAGFDDLAELPAQLARLPEAGRELLERACAAVEQRLRELKQQARSFGFIDLQVRLAQALHGEHGARLRERIRAQYPVALIDEFQDTSALQYGLFDTLYGIARNDPDAAVLLIGDPKQSIYGFRGADIGSYIRARTATAGRHYALHTNFRSSQLLVQAVNQLFARAERRDVSGASGAFRWREADSDPLPFVEVQARGRDEQWVGAGGAALPALTVEYDTELRTAGAARAEFASACAEHIVGLLADPTCGLRGPGGLERLRPRDIAVLVRTRVESECVRAELRRRGVASVYLSEQESVFASAEARDLLAWLRAVAEPRDARLARAGFASATLDLPLSELEALAHDDQVFEQRAELLQQLHDIWQRQGVLPMLRATLHRLRLPARWLTRADGERRLTNLLHLAELLQQASAGIDGEQALVRWLELATAGRAGAADEQQLRLESESDLVKVVTIHKSKGLEYPVVCVPFASHFREADEDAHDDVAPDAPDTPDADLGGDAVADELRLREDLRLLYVALTRARHALWLGASALRGKGGSCLLARSALGSLLGAGEQAEAATLGQLLGEAFEGLPQVCLRPWQAPARPTPWQQPEPAAALVEPPRYRAVFERDWSIASFSALARNLAPLRAASSARQHDLDDAADADAAADASGQAVPVRHGFARGAQAGSFLHEQLAWLAEQGFGDDAGLRAAFVQRCARQGWQHDAEAAWQWLQQVLRTPLPPLGAALHELPTRLAEMEFWFPVEAADTAALDQACARRWLGERRVPRLDARRLHGLVMGFADLVVECQGRYWVLDYKSNALGECDADYHAEALATAMAEHRYDVQASLYLLALHRLLRARLGAGYEPRRQLGGALCLFLRGIEGPQRGCFGMPADVDWLEHLDRLFTDPARAAGGGTRELAR